MPGLDARSFMDGGGSSGFGNLAAALLMAPQLRRKADQADQDRLQAQSDKADERAFRDHQLAQALQMHNDSLGLQRQQMTGEQSFRDKQLQQQRDIADQNNNREWWSNIGSGVNNALKSSMRGKAPEYKPEIYTEDYSTDDKGHLIRHRRAKTSEELDSDKRAWRYANGIPDAPGAPAEPAATPPDVLAQRQGANAAVRERQRNEGLAQAPGDPAPPRSTAGTMQPGSGAPPAPAPDAAPQQQTRRRAFLSIAGDVAPADDGLLDDMMSDDPAVVKRALMIQYRGQPRALDKAVAALRRLHGIGQ